MNLTATIGAPIDETPGSPTVAEVIINKVDDSDCDLLIVRTSDSKWLAQYDDGPEIVVANSAAALATELWNNGTCPHYVAEALFRIGWLTLDDAALVGVDTAGWRQPDVLG